MFRHFPIGVFVPQIKHILIKLYCITIALNLTKRVTKVKDGGSFIPGFSVYLLGSSVQAVRRVSGLTKAVSEQNNFPKLLC